MLVVAPAGAPHANGTGAIDMSATPEEMRLRGHDVQEIAPGRYKRLAACTSGEVEDLIALEQEKKRLHDEMSAMHVQRIERGIVLPRLVARRVARLSDRGARSVADLRLAHTILGSVLGVNGER